MSNRIVAAIIAIFILLLFFGGGVWWLVSRSHSAEQQAQSSTSAPSKQMMLNPTQPEKPPIKVGIILSHEMSVMELKPDGPNAPKDPAPWGYNHSTAIMRELRAKNIQLYPIIEPETETDPLLATILQRQFAGVAPIDGHDVSSLTTLDVIVAAQVWNSTPEMITAANQAVNNGVGLLIRQAFGDWRPGFTPEVLGLHGLKEGAYARTTPWNAPRAAEIVGEHSILGTLSGKRDIEIPDVLPTGAYGQLVDGAMPLMRLKDTSAIVSQARMQQHPDWTFYPIYTANLGKGRIICCNFDVANQPPKALSSATGNAFTIRCVEWLNEKSAATRPSSTGK